MRIRPEQFEAFQSVAEAAFTDKVTEYIRDYHAEDIVKFETSTLLVKHIPTETLQIMVQDGCIRARQYGLTWESNLAAFIVLMFVVAPNFDTYPPIHRLLQDNTIPADSRIDQLWKFTTEQDWEAAKQRYDESAWPILVEGTR